jgi:hypothetical protein
MSLQRFGIRLFINRQHNAKKVPSSHMCTCKCSLHVGNSVSQFGDKHFFQNETFQSSWPPIQTLSHKQLLLGRENANVIIFLMLQDESDADRTQVTPCRWKNKYGNLALAPELPRLQCCHTDPAFTKNLSIRRTGFHPKISSSGVCGTHPSFLFNQQAWIPLTT